MGRIREQGRTCRLHSLRPEAGACWSSLPADAEGRRLTVSVVNRDQGRPLDTRITLAGARAAGPVMVHEVTGDNPEAANSAAEPDAVATVSTKRDVSGDVLDVRFAPHSFTLLDVQLA